MPLPVTAKLPAPASRDEFDKIATDYLRVSWKDPHVQRYGRNGQQQHGVDALGSVSHLERRLGVAQFTAREAVGISKVTSDVAAMDQGFEDAPVLFLFLTATPTDATLQDFVREFSNARVAEGKCPVDVMFWETIIDGIAGDDSLLAKYYPSWFIEQEDRSARHRADEIMDQVRARAVLADALGPTVQLGVELVDAVDVRAARLIEAERHAWFTGPRTLTVEVPARGEMPILESSENVFFRPSRPWRNSRGKPSSRVYTRRLIRRAALSRRVWPLLTPQWVATRGGGRHPPPWRPPPFASAS